MIDVVVQGLKTAQDFASFAAKLEPGDVLLTSPKPSTATNPVRRAFDKAFARASSFVQGSDKTHSLIYAGKGRVVEARLGLGVRKLSLIKAVGDLNTVALRPLAPAKERIEAAQKALSLVKAQPGYALKGIVKALIKEHDLPFAIGKANGVICSDLITNSYESSLVDKPKDAVLPVDFLRSTRLHQVAEHKGAKVASSRLDREVAAGRAAYPGASPQQPLREQKVLSRAAAFQPTAAPNLERRRRLNNSLYENHLALGERERGVLRANPAAFQGSPYGAQRQLASAVHGAGELSDDPRFLFDSRQIEVPRHSAQLFRAEDDGLHGRPVDVLKTLPEDRTLNHAFMQHELGERAEFLRGEAGVPITPHATHAGTEPVLREAHALRGDPQAIKLMERTRQQHPDDVRAARYMKQLGHHPDAPLPLGGRHERTLNKMIARSGSEHQTALQGSFRSWLPNVKFTSAARRVGRAL